ncbi:MAG TPA: M28 family peptidase [Terriglobales bacterium]|jgi:aminopeptidase-like protein
MKASPFYLALVLCWASISAGQQLKFSVLKPEIIRERLQSYKGNDRQREASLRAIFQKAGCSGDHLVEQSVAMLKEPNLICTLPGLSDSVVIVGAHYDHAELGDGVADNWSGASLLASIYQILRSKPRQYTFVFVAFSGEEKGLIGSRYYVKSLTAAALTKIRAMICIDTLGLSTTEVWVKKSDHRLLSSFDAVAHALNLPLAGVNVDRVGISDEESFSKQKIPVLVVHSITQSTLRVLHSPRDNYRVINFDNYYGSYQLLTGYLVFLDQTPAILSSGNNSSPQ